MSDTNKRGTLSSKTLFITREVLILTPPIVIVLWKFFPDTSLKIDWWWENGQTLPQVGIHWVLHPLWPQDFPQLLWSEGCKISTLGKYLGPRRMFFLSIVFRYNTSLFTLMKEYLFFNWRRIRRRWYEPISCAHHRIVVVPFFVLLRLQIMGDLLLPSAWLGIQNVIIDNLVMLTFPVWRDPVNEAS